MASTEEILQEALHQNQELLKQQAEFIKQINRLNEQIAYLTHKMYGRHSEKIPDPRQQSLFGDNSVFIQPEQTGEQSEEQQTVVIQVKHAKRKRTEFVANNLPTEDKVYDPDTLQCEHGHPLSKVGRHFVHQEIRLIPGRLFKVNVYENRYKCQECERDDGRSHLYQGHAPRALMAHSLASTSLVTEVAYMKYGMGTPLYRQVNYWKGQGLTVSDKTMANWMITCAQLIKPVYSLLHQQLMAEKFLQGDETPYQVLKEPDKAASSKSYIWLARTIVRAPQQVVYYAYAPSRAGRIAQQLYSGFTGVLQCDGYSGYNAISDSVEHVGCWAHVRRKFYDDAHADKNHFKPTEGLKLINRMFALERQWRELSSEKRREKRQNDLRPVIDGFWQWCDQTDALPKTRLGKAIAYAQGQRAALNRVLLYGEMDLSNNASELNMKSYVIGRKNWLFSTSPKGAEANAIWMSIIQSAKANGINVREYIQFLLEKMSQLPTFAKDEELEAYLPWNYKVDKPILTH